MMSYLSRESAPLKDELWEQIDSEIVKSARSVLTGRRFLSVFGPLGIGAESVAVDDADALGETEDDGMILTTGRKYVEIPTIFEDFTLYAKDIEGASASGRPADLSAVATAAVQCAFREDKLIFFGNGKFGYPGLTTASGVNKMKKKDWNVGENAYLDIAAAMEMLVEKAIYGPYSLAVSPDLYMQMQRIQQGMGMLELERVKKLLDGRLYKSPVLGKETAVLTASDAKNVDLVIGQDMSAAYLEQKNLNHVFRVLETVMPRVKRPAAIVVLS